MKNPRRPQFIDTDTLQTAALAMTASPWLMPALEELRQASLRLRSGDIEGQRLIRARSDALCDAAVKEWKAGIVVPWCFVLHQRDNLRGIEGVAQIFQVNGNFPHYLVAFEQPHEQGLFCRDVPKEHIFGSREEASLAMARFEKDAHRIMLPVYSRQISARALAKIGGSMKVIFELIVAIVVLAAAIVYVGFIDWGLTDTIVGKIFWITTGGAMAVIQLGLILYGIVFLVRWIWFLLTHGAIYELVEGIRQFNERHGWNDRKFKLFATKKGAQGRAPDHR